MAATVNPVVLFIRRNTFAVVCVGLSVLFGGVSLFLYQQRANLESRLQQRTLEGEEMLALLGSGPRLREQNAVAKEAVDKVESHLVTEANLAENMGAFYEIEEATGSRLSELRQLNAPIPEEGSPYKNVPYSLQLDGSFEQVAQYLFRLETGPRLTKLVSFTLQRREGGPGGGPGGPPPPPGAAGDPSAPPSNVNLALNFVVLGRP
jgi:Tfp pilus assembly protein PilO